MQDTKESPRSRARRMERGFFIESPLMKKRVSFEIECLIVPYFPAKSNADGVEFTKYLRRRDILRDKSAPKGDTERDDA